MQTPLTPASTPTPGTPGAPNLRGRRVHFIGVGGCGMSGLARMVQQYGALCTGSDRAGGEMIDTLRSAGVAVNLDQTAASLPADCDIVVISAAIAPDHAELVEAQRRGTQVVKYAQMLGQLMRGRLGVAVAGTHGKSTTTSVLSHILVQAELDPSFIVGANCPQLGGGWRAGQGTGADAILVAEACEYDRSFHNFHPTHSVILNVEEDHLDCYGSLEAIVESFATFADKLPAHGSLLIQHEMPHRLAITAGLDCQVETLGFAPGADWRIEISDFEFRISNLQDQQQATSSQIRNPKSEIRNSPPITRLHHRGRLVAAWRSPMPGDHMAYNAAAAAILAHRLGASWEVIAQAVARFRGLDRRMQLLGEKEPRDQGTKGPREEKNADSAASPSVPILVVDDYGHHPTEVEATLRALRQHYQPRRLVCVFQPHQHSRTRFLMQQFAESFSEADIVIVPHIYFVRDSEQERHAVTAGDLVDRLRHKGVQAMHLYPFDAIVEQLQLITRPGDLLVTMGAGDVWKVARDFLAAE